MGSPTYRGLQSLQHWLKESAFPLPVYRTGICRTVRRTYACGLPIERDFVEGSADNLGLLAEQFPYVNPTNVALCAEDGSYGIRFVESVYVQESCALNVNLDVACPEQSIPYITVEMEAFGSPRFTDFIEQRKEVIRDVARYGKEHPSLWERIEMNLWPAAYAFPREPAAAA